MVAVVSYFPDQFRAVAVLNRALLVATWLVGCWAFLSIFNSMVWYGMVVKKRGRPLPRLVTDIFSMLVILFVISMLAVDVFEFTPLKIGLWVGGIALLLAVFFRDIFANLFAGLSINLDDSIDIGDLIELPDGVRGVVEEIHWRSTQLRHPGGGYLVVPNVSLASATVLNLNALGTQETIELSVILDFSVPVERGVRVLYAALRSCEGQGGILRKPAAQVWASQPGEFGIEYRLRFCFRRDEVSQEVIRTRVTSQMMKHLESTGLALALPKQNVFLGKVRTKAMNWEDAEDRLKLISRVDLLQGLESDELLGLSESIIIHHFAAGEEIIREGELTTSMYGVAEGLLGVSVNREGMEALAVATMQPGEFFGEMSMFANEPRSATVTAIVDSVVFELNRDSIKKLLEQRIEIATSISRLVAERQVSNSKQLANASEEERLDAISTATSTLASRIKSIFSKLISIDSQVS